MRLLGWIFTLIIIIFGVAFSALNATRVNINYLLGKQDLPLSVIILISFAVGIILSIIILGTKIISLTAKNKWLTSKLKKTEDHINHLEAP
ncbi:MAG: lipopolysaccharide assembly LapA domain-containing protein [Candidatus Berkiella sp.]